MGVPNWPSDVPYGNEADGATASQPYAPPIKSETEGGPPLSRPRPGPRPTEIAWRSVPLDDAQWQSFERFTVATLRQGTLIFEMPVFKPGEGFVSRKCELRDGIYQTDFSQPPWTRVSFVLIVYNW